MNEEQGVGEGGDFSGGVVDAPDSGFGGAPVEMGEGESAAFVPEDSWEDHLYPPEKEAAPAPPELPADAIPIAKELAEAAKSAGFESVESFVQARLQEQAASEQRQTRQREEQRWLGDAQRRLVADYQARVDAGEMTQAQARELYSRDLALAQYQRSHDQASMDLSQRQVEHAIHQASSANPLLGVDNGLAGSLIRAMSLSGLMPTDTAVSAVSRFAQAIEQKAVADYVAREAEKSKNAAPVFRAGGGPTATSVSEGGKTGDWAEFLFRRSGIR